MKMLTEIRLLFFRQALSSLRNPVFLFMGVTVPIMYLALFAPLLKNFATTQGFPTKNVLDTFVPGMLPMIAFFSGLFSGFGIIDELRSGIIERFRVTPAKRFSLLAGTVMHDLSAMICQSLLFVLLAVPFGFRMNLLGFFLLMLLLCLLAATTSSFGNAIGLAVKSEDKLAPIIQGINLPILLLSGMLLPIALAPTWLKIIAHFNPVYYVVEAARCLAAGNTADPMVLYSFCFMIPITFITMTWATNIFRKAVM